MLGSNDIHDRDAAERALIKLGDSARTAMEPLLKDSRTDGILEWTGAKQE